MPITPAYAQSYTFAHYQVENGLSNNTVLCSLQDRNGFMWFGTKDGLNRFDGYAFKVFRNIPNNAASIGNNVIYCLFQDKSGIIWAGTERGIYKYDTYTESFGFFAPGTENEIRDIKEDDKGSLWFIAGTSLYNYSFHDKKRTDYSATGINAVSLAFADGCLWVGTTARLVEKYNPLTHTFTTYDVFEHSKPATSYWIQKIAATGDGSLFIGTSNQGIKLLDIKTGKYKDILSYNKDGTEIFVRDFIRQSSSLYWIATESGIYIYNKVNGSAQLLHKQYNNPYALSDNSIYTFSKDREGGIWAGSYFGGLNYYARQYTYFEKYFPKVGENSLSGNAIREICPDSKGNLWIGTEDAGLNKFNPQTGLFVNYKPLGKPGNISTSNIHGLLTSGNHLLIGTFEHGLDIMDINTGKIIHHHTALSDTTLKSNFFYTLYKIKNGNIITGTSRGLYYYDATNRHFTLAKEVPATLFYTSVLEDHSGGIWVGSYLNGLFYFDPKTQKSKNFLYSTKNERSISDNKINNIFQDSNFDIWVATENGLCKYNAIENNFSRYTAANGLPSNVIYAILEDSKKNLWISTSKGLVAFNLKTQAVKVYTKANGLLSDQFNYNSAYKDLHGNMYFGCVKGMIRFNPDSFVNNNYQPPVYITQLQINGKDIAIAPAHSPLHNSISFTDTVKLLYNQSSISIDFAALSYTSPQTASYAYQMSGFDKDWVYLHRNRKVYFTRLSPGTYTFKLKASNDGYSWSEYERRLTVIISPPFWATIYAYFIYAGLFVLGIVTLIRNYHRRVQEKNQRKIELLENEKEREIYHAKIAFFTHVAHEIRTPLTLIVGPMEKVIQKATQVPEIRKNLAIMERNTRRLLDLTNQLLDFSKTETHGFSLNFVKTDIVAFIKESLLRFMDAAQQKHIHIRSAFDSEVFYAYVDTEALNKILSNLLDNALKYASAKVSVHLLINEDNNSFTILTKSDGAVIPSEMKEKIFETFFRMKEAEKQSGTGIGLPLSRYLAELHKGTLTLKQSEGNMNVFALTLPIHQAIEFNL